MSALTKRERDLLKDEIKDEIMKEIDNHPRVVEAHNKISHTNSVVVETQNVVYGLKSEVQLLRLELEEIGKVADNNSERLGNVEADVATLKEGQVRLESIMSEVLTILKAK
ncbi:hypothetical protein [Endozoicomonas sp. ONNA1]|uniref:hypothetical protein n=1 Tax=Endozoicomonas sp. ONNA1 TaxID=2828740 RepID=UPI002148C5FB|nr:hypothetical protein [Endozoicomonas sp. ONNA1]